VEQHLADDRGNREYSDPVTGIEAENRVEEHRHGTHAGQGRAVLDRGGNPDRLLGWQQVAGGERFDLGYTLEGVFELVKIMGMPAGDELLADFEG
jgi:hypothetical protein